MAVDSLQDSCDNPGGLPEALWEAWRSEEVQMKAA